MNICREYIKDPPAWKRVDVENDRSWIIQLDEQDIAELEGSRKHVVEMGFRWGEFGHGDFPLPVLRQKLLHGERLLREGRGFVLFRGIPVERYTLDEMKMLYWGIGVHLGIPMGQNRKGELITHVEDYSEAPETKPGGRQYRGTGELNPHTDYTDVVGLLCVRSAKEGGRSAIMSSMTLHNHLLEHHPEYLQTLYEGMHTTLRYEGPTRLADEPSPQPVPIFEYHNGHLSCFFARGRLLGGQDAIGHPFTDQQLRAIDCVWKTSRLAEYTLEMDLQPGDIQFLNNHMILHSRTSYVDYEERDRKRLLLRLWVRLDEEDYRVSPARSRLLRWGMDRVRAALV